MRHAVVVGAGIGGLTAAAALRQQGWAVTVLERAASIEPVGAGLAMAPNALRALDVIGVGDPVRKLAAFQGSGGIRTKTGKWLSRTSAEAAEQRYGDPTVLLHRADLVGLLAEKVPGIELGHLGGVGHRGRRGGDARRASSGPIWWWPPTASGRGSGRRCSRRCPPRSTRG